MRSSSICLCLVDTTSDPLLTTSSCTDGIVHVRIGDEGNVNGFNEHGSGAEMPDKG